MRPAVDEPEWPALDFAPAQVRLLQYVARGYRGPQAAAVIGIAPQTAANWLMKMRDAAGVRTTAGLVALAIGAGLIAAPGPNEYVG